MLGFNQDIVQFGGGVGWELMCWFSGPHWGVFAGRWRQMGVLSRTVTERIRRSNSSYARRTGSSRRLNGTHLTLSAILRLIEVETRFLTVILGTHLISYVPSRRSKRGRIRLPQALLLLNQSLLKLVSIPFTLVSCLGLQFALVRRTSFRDANLVQLIKLHPLPRPNLQNPLLPFGTVFCRLLQVLHLSEHQSMAARRPLYPCAASPSSSN